MSLLALTTINKAQKEEGKTLDLEVFQTRLQKD